MQSYKSTGFPTQRTVYSNVDDGKQPINLDYIQKQSNLIRSQNQPYQGHIPNYIEPVPNDNLIQQTRYQLDAPSTRYNTNKLDNTRKNSNNNSNRELEASEIFTGPNQEYSPYIDYLTKKGLLNDNYKSRIKTTYINIDSKARKINPTIMKQDDILLENNSLFFTSTESSEFATITEGTKINLLNITIQEHNFHVGDRITINGVKTEKYSIKAIYGYSNTGELDDKYYYSVIFQEDSKSLIIKTNFSASVFFSSNDGNYFIEETPNNFKNSSSSFDPNFKVGDGILYDNLKKYDTSDMFVSFTGFIGEFIGNVPTNFLNSSHRVYFTNPDESGEKFINVPNGDGVVEEITGFYIELPSNFKLASSDTDTTNIVPLSKDFFSDMVIDMDFKYIGGIPVNSINSDVPITNENINGYQTIVSITKNTISIRLNKDTYYIESTPPNNPEIGEIPVRFGGDTVIISKVIEIIGGFPEQNDYIIELPQTIHNVFMIKLVSSIFPNTSRTFKKQKNNKIYWQNLDDGKEEYIAEIEEGNYNPIDLKAELEKKMYSIVRIVGEENPVNNFIYTADNLKGYDPDLNENLKNVTKSLAYPNGEEGKIINKGGYTNRVLFSISIDQNTNITSFSSFKEAKLRRPIIKIIDSNGKSPPEQKDATDPIKGNYEPPYTIKIAHPKHGLEINDEVLFTGFITTNGIPDEILNRNHKISNISSDDTYEIIIDNFNLSLVRNDTYGGYSAKVFVKNKFRLLFNKPDTMGVQLGFRNVGSELAITKYDTTITNQQEYQNEIVTFEPPTGFFFVSDGSGKQIVLRNNSLRFSGEDYIYLVIREFGGNINISQNKQLVEYFAKINLSGLPGKILYDTAVFAPVTYYDMLDLKQLAIKIYGSDGDLYDFNGIDHSFVIEITSLNLLPQETGINSTSNFI
jgi:hypothetical protein